MHLNGFCETKVSLRETTRLTSRIKMFTPVITNETSFHEQQETIRFLLNLLHHLFYVTLGFLKISMKVFKSDVICLKYIRKEREC